MTERLSAESVVDAEYADWVLKAACIRLDVARLPEDLRRRLIARLSADYIDGRQIDDGGCA